MAALARSVLRYSARHEAAASDSFSDHVIAGLSDSPKWLSAKYFYDAAGSELLELKILDGGKGVIADAIFTSNQDRRNRNFLSIRDQHTFKKEFRQKRLMTLIHLFLIHRYKSVSIHYVSPTEDNLKQTQGMKALGIYDDVNTEVGDVIVARVNTKHVKSLMNPNGKELKKLIAKRQ